MTALFRWFILRRLAREPGRTGLTVAGVALGVAVVLAVRLANASAIGGFAEALDTVAGRTSLEIVGTGTGVAESHLARLQWLAEWGVVTPVIEGDAVAMLASGREEAVRVLGVDVLREEPFREYTLDVGDAPQPPAASLLMLLADPASVVITESFARRHGLSADPAAGPGAAARGSSQPERSRLRLAMGDAVGEFRIRAVLNNRGPARLLDGNFVLMDIAAAQWAFDRLGRVDRVDLRLADPSQLDQAERAIASRLPPGLGVQRPARRGAQVERMLEAFQFNLAALSYVALLVGLFLVHNTVATSVIARRTEIGVLRALGTPRLAVLGLFVGEAAVLALAGGAAGAPLGWALARGAIELTSSTVTTLYAAQASGVPALTWAEAGLALVVSVPLAIAAALGPAHEASRVSPAGAIGGADAAGDARRARRWAAAGAACLAAAVPAAMAGPVGGLPLFGFASAILIVCGLAALSPLALGGASRLLRSAGLRWLGIEGHLAQANVAAATRRLSVSVAALAVSLAMLVAIAIMIGSFRETVIHWVGQTLRADLYVATARRANLDAQATISPQLEQALAADPDVAAIDRFRALSVTFRDRLIVLGSGDFPVLLAHGGLAFKAPADGPGALRSAIGRDAVIVSESLSLRFGVDAGDRIDLPTPGGARPFTVAAVYYDYSTDRGVVVMDRATFTRHFGALPPTSLSIYLRAGADAAAVRERLMAALGSTHRLFIHTNATLRAEVLRIFDATFAVTYGLEAVAIVVAVLGVTGTLLTLMLERRRELAVLRLVGADLRQIRRMIVIEAGILGLVGQALGLVAGLALSLVLIYVINVQSFGWTIQFHLPAAFLAQAMAFVLLATTLAGAYPARVAAGFRPVDEVVTE